MKRWLLASAVSAALFHVPQPAIARDHMWIVGSHAVQPFTKAVAERAARASGAPAPVVEDTGTTPGFGYLCAGTGDIHPDAVSASRRMRKAEFDTCERNGVKAIAEIPVGLDIVVIAQSKAGPSMRLTLAQMAVALARQIPDEGGELVSNPHRIWSAVDRALPASAIDFRVLPPVAGTRDVLQGLFIEGGAIKVPGIARLAAGDGVLPKAVRTMRDDPPYIMVHESEATIARQLVARPQALGVLSYRVFHANRATLRGVPIDGVEPTVDSAYAGRYVGTRKLYVYARTTELKRGLGRLGPEFTSGDALGPNGYLLALGFVPLDAMDMLKAMTQADTMLPLQRDDLPE
jgi:phosphate transport system substrate-binding protein